ncbi:xylose dehydrogenase (NAD/NADP) [Halogranum rubrum]|uniref:Xylose dehydrogenase (NAD/NADP) n=1 Tax=Halogranum rubrum TaxID=553466 RepID=A0A1I4GUL4_9EURY|nr:D-xylose 1-dehydrogenase Gfo6 [Halogranum rubrum]SFL33665.1 xylose dehydrogenase (NAD/NADP) [Halogranum rubrum]
MTLDNWLERYDEQDWKTQSEGTVRYALVGLGWWTTDVAIPAIEASSLCEVTTLVSSSKEKAERIAQTSDVETGITYDEFHDGVAADEYDVVYIATPNAYHLEYAETAARLGKGVLCEKPMEADVERAERMVDACDTADVPLMVAYRMQTEPAVRRARELVESGFIGDPVYVYGNNSQPLLEMIPDPDQWRLNPDLTGYGTSVMDLGIYSINTARFLLDRDPRSVQAQLYSEHEAFEGLDDERASFMLDFGDGIQMVSTASQNAQQDTMLRITGTEGQLELSPAFHGECQLHVKKGDLSVDVEHTELDEVDEMEYEFDYFADRLLGDAEIHPDGEHGLFDMTVVEAIHRSDETGERVEIETR